jgi:bifunctional non-homologous end joining protein LigD
MSPDQQVETIECEFCHQTYRYDQKRNCWSCDANVCPHCLPDGPQPVCPECRQELPGGLEPMLAATGQLPDDPDEWGFEYKWDGVRALCRWDGGSMMLTSRNGNAITSRYPELGDLGQALPGRILLDGEIVALDEQGRPSFPLLQQRMHRRRDVVAAARKVPVQYFVFDVLYEAGRDLRELPYTRRREILEAAELDHPHLRVPPSHVGAGREMLAAAKKVGLEGVMAKRLDSLYEPGLRSGAWRKVKIVHRQELVIGGWIPQQKEEAKVGSLQVGYYAKGRLRYAGGVGTGFAASDHRMLVGRLKELETPECPFDVEPNKSIRWVAPQLVAEIEYRRWPEGKQIQQAAYKGLRDDVEPGRVVREPIVGA